MMREKPARRIAGSSEALPRERTHYYVEKRPATGAKPTWKVEDTNQAPPQRLGAWFDLRSRAREMLLAPSSATGYQPISFFGCSSNSTLVHHDLGFYPVSADDSEKVNGYLGSPIVICWRAYGFRKRSINKRHEFELRATFDIAALSRGRGEWACRKPLRL